MGIMTKAATAVCLCLLTATLAQAEKVKSCDAKPRWLLVTVLAFEFHITGLQNKQGENISVDPTPKIYPKGTLRLLDRCKGTVSM